MLTARLQTDFLERRFGRYRQMSGGRFLVALREVLTSERILATRVLLKEGFNVWEEDLREVKFSSSDVDKSVDEVRKIQNQIQEVQLSDDSMELCVYVAGYLVKSLLDKTSCAACKTSLLDHDNDEHTGYLQNVSRGGLSVPSLALSHYASSIFGTLEILEHIVVNSNVCVRPACEHLLKLFGPSADFVCRLHNEWAQKITNRIIINIFYNNLQKESKA